MASEEDALKAFQAKRDELLKQRTGPSTSGAGQAFVGTDMSKPGDLPDLSTKSGPSGLGILGGGLDIAAGYAGENRAAALIDALPIPEQYKVPADVAARVLGGGAAVLPTHLAWSELRRHLGDKTGSDNFDQSVKDSYEAALSQANAGALGAGASKFAGLLHPSGRADPSRIEDMKQVKDSLVRVYENAGGKPLVEDMRSRWNPMRILKPLENELDDSTVVQRLKDKGLDPQMARRVALTGGHTTANLLDNSMYRTLQSVAESSPVGSRYLQNYKTTRGKMFNMMAEDLANEFGDHLPEEQVGKAISNAVDGNFNVPNTVMNASLNNIRGNLNAGSSFNVGSIRDAANRAGLDPNGPARLVHEMPSLPNGRTSFDNIQQVRSYLSSIIHSQEADPKEIDEAKRMAKTLDRSMVQQMPSNLRKSYKDAVSADDTLNEGQFNTSFVKGLLGRQDGYRQYAVQLLREGDVGNFNKLEAAVGPDEANKVRRSISEIVTQNAADSTDGTLMPHNLDKMLNEHGDYGRYFLQSTLGDGWMRNVERMKGSMENINALAQNNPVISYGTKALTATAVAKLAYDAYHGDLGYSDAALFGAILSPKVMAKALTNPEATKQIEKMSALIRAGKNPGTVARLATRTAVTMGLDPTQLLKDSNYNPKNKDASTFDLENVAMPAMVL